MSTSLPYQGNLQEAIKNRDRSAVKQLMSLREFDSEEKDDSSSILDAKLNVSDLVSHLIVLGFPVRQVHEFIQCDNVESVEEQNNDFLEEAVGLKSLFEYSDRHFPIPKRKPIRRLQLNEDTSEKGFRNIRVTPLMLRGMDVDFTWTLMQTCIDNPDISQTDCYDVLYSIQTLVKDDLLSSHATSFLRNSLIAGYLVEVRFITDTLGLLLAANNNCSSSCSPAKRSRSASEVSSPLCDDKGIGSDCVNFEFSSADNSTVHALTEEDNDALLQSYICPITREILVEPITLQVSE